MSAKTTIEWTDASWNPIVGCTEVSPGCANCYAARLAATRLRNTPQYKELAVINSPRPNYACRWTGEVRFLPERLEEPLHWRNPRRIFVCDMGDLFHEAVHGDWIDQVLAIMDRCPQHTFQILTKRAQRMHDLLRHYPVKKNMHPGVSVENQHFADKRIPLLLDTPAAVRFISAEPLLGPVDIREVPVSPAYLLKQKWIGGGGLDWVICGGESGPNARPMHPDWARSLRDQCVAAGVPFFFKQWGEWIPGTQRPEHIAPRNGFIQSDGSEYFAVGKKQAGRLLDRREWNEFPERVNQ